MMHYKYIVLVYGLLGTNSSVLISREELQRKDGQLRNKGLITGSEVQGKIAAGVMAAEGTAVLGANRIAHLEVELKQAKVD